MVARMKIQQPCSKDIAKPSTGLQWQRFSPWLFYLNNLLLAIGYVTLLLYALIWKAGNIVDSPTRKIGFYNFCWWDQEAEKQECFKNLEKPILLREGLTEEGQPKIIRWE